MLTDRTPGVPLGGYSLQSHTEPRHAGVDADGDLVSDPLYTNKKKKFNKQHAAFIYSVVSTCIQ